MAGYRGIPRDTAGYWERPGETGTTRSTTADTASDTGRYGQIVRADIRAQMEEKDRGRYGEIAQKSSRLGSRAWSLSLSLQIRKLASMVSLTVSHRSPHDTNHNTLPFGMNARVYVYTPLTVTPGAPAARPHRTRARQKNLKRTPKSMCPVCVKLREPPEDLSAPGRSSCGAYTTTMWSRL